MLLFVWIGGISWSKTGTTHYNAQLGLPDKGCAIKGLVIFISGLKSDS